MHLDYHIKTSFMYHVSDLRFKTIPSYCRLIAFMGSDHLQLTLLNWDTKSVLALNKKLKVNQKFQFFI